MTEKERKLRLAQIGKLFTGLNRRREDQTDLAYVQATTTIPLRWLTEAVASVVRIWEPGPKFPTPRTLYEHAARAAGMKPRYSAWGGYTDPEPGKVLWWPKTCALPLAYAERWNERPPVEIETANVPEGRRLLEASVALLPEPAVELLEAEN